MLCESLPGMFIRIVLLFGLAPIAATNSSFDFFLLVPDIKVCRRWSDHSAVSFALNAKYLKRSVPFFAGFRLDWIHRKQISWYVYQFVWLEQTIPNDVVGYHQFQCLNMDTGAV